MERDDAYHEELERRYEFGKVRPDSRNAPVLSRAEAMEASRRYFMCLRGNHHRISIRD